MSDAGDKKGLRGAVQDEEMPLRFLFRVIRERWKLIQAFALVGALLWGSWGLQRHGGYLADIELTVKAYPEALQAQEESSGEPTSPRGAQAALDRVSLADLTDTVASKADPSEPATAPAPPCLTLKTHGGLVRIVARNRTRDKAEQLATLAAESFVELNNEALAAERQSVASFLDAEVDRAREALGATPDDESARLRFERLLARQQDAELRAQWGEGEATVARSAESRPSQKRLLFTSLTMGAMLGFLLGTMTAFLLEQLDTCIRHPRDVKERLGLPAIDCLREFKPTKGIPGHQTRHEGADLPGRGDFLRIDDGHPVVKEDFGELALSFEHFALPTKAKTWMVTSTIPGEGKTTAATNLALVLAHRGKRVALVDMDLHRPGVHHMLELERGPGLSDVLSRSVELTDALQPSGFEDLTVLTAGAKAERPSALMRVENLEPILQALASDHDFVICDSPPALSKTDTLTVAGLVDAVLLLVAARNARRETICQARDLLFAAGSEIIGVVLNGLRKKPKSQYYYYYCEEDGNGAHRRRWINSGT